MRKRKSNIDKLEQLEPGNTARCPKCKSEELDLLIGRATLEIFKKFNDGLVAYRIDCRSCGHFFEDRSLTTIGG